jgi:hypothetical protein
MVVEQAEAYIRNLGFEQLRVRYVGGSAGADARVEVGVEQLSWLLSDSALQNNIVNKLQSIGFKNVVIDNEGYRQGKANASLAQGKIWINAYSKIYSPLSKVVKQVALKHSNSSSNCLMLSSILPNQIL